MTALARGLEAVLGPRLLGLYLGGSAALGGFAAASSDLDFLAVIDGPLEASDAAAIAHLHDRLRVAVPYGDRLEGDYAPHHTLVPTGTTEPTAGCWDGRFVARFAEVMLSADNLANMRACGVAFHGPPAEALLPVVSADQVRAAARAMLEDEPSAHARAEEAAREILNDLRSLRSIQTAAPSTKDDGAAWALAHWPAQWQPVIEAAQALRRGTGSPEAERRVIQERLPLHAAALAWLREAQPGEQ